MGHEINYCVCDVNADLKQVEAQINDEVARATWEESGNGLGSPIRWIDYLCADKEEAYKYIDEHDRHNYDQLAVKFCVYDNLTQTAKLEGLKARVVKCRKVYYAKATAIHYANVKSEFIGCKTCGSRLARKYITQNICPLCRNDLRPQSTLDSIAKAKAALDLAEKQYNDAVKEQQRKQQKQAKIKWLIKYEYHM